MSDVQAAGARAAILKVLNEMVSAAYAEARAEADAQLAVLNDSLGVASVNLRLPGSGTTVAQLTQSSGKPRFTVTEQDLVAYCEHEYPTEVETLKAIRPAFRKALLARLEIVDGAAVDRTTGRVVECVTVHPGQAGTTLSFAAAGRDEVAAAYRNGRFAVKDLLALIQPEE